MKLVLAALLAVILLSACEGDPRTDPGVSRDDALDEAVYAVQSDETVDGGAENGGSWKLKAQYIADFAGHAAWRLEYETPHGPRCVFVWHDDSYRYTEVQECDLRATVPAGVDGPGQN